MGPQIRLFHSTSPSNNVDGGKKSIPSWGHCVYGVCMFSSRLHGFSPRLWFPPTSQRYAREVTVCLYCPSGSECECEYGCECALQWKEALSRVGPTCARSCQDTPTTLNWNQWIRKEFLSLFLFIVVKCVYSSPLFQCLALELFGVFI